MNLKKTISNIFLFLLISYSFSSCSNDAIENDSNNKLDSEANSKLRPSSPYNNIIEVFEVFYDGSQSITHQLIIENEIPHEGSEVIIEEPIIRGTTFIEGDNGNYQNLNDNPIFDTGGSFISGPNVCLTVNFIVVQESDGSGGATNEDLDQIISDLNRYFGSRIPSVVTPIVEPNRIQFKKSSSMHTIPFSTWYNIDSIAEYNALLTSPTVYEADMLNIYLVNSMPGLNIGGAVGIGPMNDNRALIEIEDFLHVFTGLVSHEIGHNLGLYHTFSTANGEECSNYSNGFTTGDLIFDTPADDAYFFNNGYTSDCDPMLLPQNYLDPCNLPYNPQLNNVMTWNINCLEGFTYLQMVKMKQTIGELNLQVENCSSGSSSTF